MFKRILTSVALPAALTLVSSAFAGEAKKPAPPTFSQLRNVLTVTEKDHSVTGLKNDCDGTRTKKCWYVTITTDRGPILARCWEKADLNAGCDGNFHRVLRGEQASK